MSDKVKTFNVIIIGAGLSGISAAYHLKKYCFDKSFSILEAREAIGGTWDLFRYPGIRSDSDMFTLGFGFRPWPNAKAIADGPAIKKYIEDTADDLGVRDNINFGRRVTSMSWSSAEQVWSLTVDHNGTEEIYRCNFVFSCAGYYRYSEGYTPDFPGVEDFQGRMIHPQKWPEDLDYKHKRIVVIGSGATAVTLVPALTEKAAHVTMLQRSPSYYFSMPGTSSMARSLSKMMPRSAAHSLMRWQRVLFQQATFKLMRAYPEKSAKNLIKMVKDRLQEGFDTKQHFTPTYNPWDQRVCVVPDDDLFAAINAGDASVVTDTIEKIDEGGIVLASGERLDADIIVTATGLVLQTFGGAALHVDGEEISPGDVLAYKGVLFEGVPNLVSVFGYTNASWTLRADLVNAYACRIVNYLEKHNYGSVTPVNEDPDLKREAFLDFTSGYVTRAADRLPKQGAREPWRHPQDYLRDVKNLRYGKIDDGILKFKPAVSAAKSKARPSAYALTAT